MRRLPLLLLLLGGCDANPAVGETDDGSTTSTGADAAGSTTGDATSGGVTSRGGGSTTKGAASTSTGAADDGQTSSTGSGGSSSSSDDGAGSSSTGVRVETCPAPPAGLSRWLVGNEVDADVDPTGPGLILMGGGPDVDEAFDAAFGWAAGGDAVVIRASGSDGYNDYFLDDIGGLDSVETLRVDGAVWADDPYVACRVEQAEVIFFAGGDQADYMTLYANSPLAEAVQSVYERGGVIGGTSAGLAILGEFVFAAYEGTVYPDEVLEDPYNMYTTMDEGPFAFAPLQGVVTDSHFYERDRMGRLLGFMARIAQDGWNPDPVGIGVDEVTALVIDPEGVGTVHGDGFVYVASDGGTPEVCMPGVPLTHAGLDLLRLQAGETVTLPGVTDASVATDEVGAVGGALVPANPY
ncbi:MAG: cyanophycinase [Myxococcota bacterium]